MQLYMVGRLKSIYEFKESKLQIHRSKKEHLRQQITPEYRYIRSKKSKSPHRSTYFDHDTQQSSALLFIRFAITYCKKTSDMNFSEYGGSDWKYLKTRILR